MWPEKKRKNEIQKRKKRSSCTGDEDVRACVQNDRMRETQVTDKRPGPVVRLASCGGRPGIWSPSIGGGGCSLTSWCLAFLNYQMLGVRSRHGIRVKSTKHVVNASRTGTTQGGTRRDPRLLQEAPREAQPRRCFSDTVPLLHGQMSWLLAHHQPA